VVYVLEYSDANGTYHARWFPRVRSRPGGKVAAVAVVSEAERAR
jgi:hypothetical protein